MTNQVIDLEAHREHPGVVWFQGTFACTMCKHQHVGVVPMPSWAVGPTPVTCPECGIERAAYAVADGAELCEVRFPSESTRSIAASCETDDVPL